MATSRKSSACTQLVDDTTSTSMSSLPEFTSQPDQPTKTRLLSRDLIPAWYAHNDYIYGGYRPVRRSVRLCLDSLFYFHNESVNIYSHLIPGIIALLGNRWLHIYFDSHFPLASWADQLVFHVYLTTSVICFGVSAAFHTLLCHSARYSSLWCRLDFLAIVGQILGSIISGVYLGFYCEPHLQTMYWIMIVIFGSVTGFIVVHPRLQNPQYRILRLGAFVATGLSAFAPIIHAAAIFPYEQLDKQAGLRYYYLEGVAVLAGVVFYATHFPESWWPGRFDILGASHQIFHTFVALGAVVHFHGILTAYEWNYVNQRC